MIRRRTPASPAAAVPDAAAPATRRGPDGRFESLDGLRGFACLAVLLLHTFAMDGTILAVLETDAVPPIGSWAWWMGYTPLHLLWAGGEAVMLFFVLSGFVLTLPMLGPKPQPWLSYYPRRLIRLYLPVFGAVALVWILVAIFPSEPPTDLGAWIETRAYEYPPGHVVKDLTLVGGVSPAIGPLWSLRVEVYFSLLLPLYVLFARVLRGLVWLKVVAVFALLAVTGVLSQHVFGTELAFHLLVFAVGAIFAAHWEDLGRIATWLDRRPALWVAMLAVALVLVLSRWGLILLGAGQDVAYRSRAVTVVGVALAMFLAAYWRPMANGLSLAPFRWLGRVSFTLYLTHETVVHHVRLLTRDLPLAVSIVIAVAAAFLVAEVMYRLIEGPSQELSRRVGKRITAWWRERAAKRAGADRQPVEPVG